MDDVGLAYICATTERIFAVGWVFAIVVSSLAEQPSVRLLKHIIRCYLRLSENQRVDLKLLKIIKSVIVDRIMLAEANNLKSDSTRPSFSVTFNH